MSCSNCGAEVPSDAAKCPKCGAAVVAADAAGDADWADVVTVLRSSDSSEIAVAKSLLEAEGIKVLAEGEGIDDTAGFDHLSGFSRLQVERENEEAALALLANRNAVIPEGETE